MTQAQLRGTPVVPGIVAAPARWLRRQELPELSQQEVPVSLREGQADRFIKAADAVAARLESRAEAASGTVRAMMEVAASMARDTTWREQIHAAINSGKPALTAVVEVTDSFVGLFTRAGGQLAERVSDLRDMHDRVVAQLQGLPEPGVIPLDSPVILVADDLSPADTAALDPQLVLAFVTESSGPTSHTAIIARQMGIPCIVACRDLQVIQDGQQLLIDGGSGDIWVAPEAAFVEKLLERDRSRRERAASWQGPAQLADGTPVALLANIQDAAGARQAANSGATGVGLLRTELTFMRARSEPSEIAQATAYGEIFNEFPGQSVLVRTLDFGSDKPLPWTRHAREDNPALGVRGNRLERTNKGIVERQLRAIMVAARKRVESGDTGATLVMAPMVSTLNEAQDFVSATHDLAAQYGVAAQVKAGVMIEVPALAVMAEQLLPLVDFVSIGTNDLAQYVMAADRLNPALADLNDMWQPAVLQLIRHVATVGQGIGVPVGICGEAAADPLLACVFLGMGVTSLSAATTVLPQVGALLERVTLEQCRAAAGAVARTTEPRAARFAAADHLIDGANNSRDA